MLEERNSRFDRILPLNDRSSQYKAFPDLDRKEGEADMNERLVDMLVLLIS